LREQRASQIRVEDGAGGVHDSREPEVTRRVDRCFEPVEDGFLPERAGLERLSLPDLAPQLVEDLAALPKDVGPAESSEQGFRSWMREEPVYGRQFAERISSHREEMVPFVFLWEKEGARWRRWSSKPVWGS
jgi:hypothetical protein